MKGRITSLEMGPAETTKTTHTDITFRVTKITHIWTFGEIVAVICFIAAVALALMSRMGMRIPISVPTMQSSSVVSQPALPNSTAKTAAHSARSTNSRMTISSNVETTG